ncbi:MAG: prolyl oligopeptidase family serine peptidase [Planctomycetota bacterium]
MRLLPAALVALTALAHAQDPGRIHRFKESAQNRKCGLYVPDGLRRKETVPLLVALPDTRGLAMHEIDQWRHLAFTHRFAVLSVDIMTSRERGWHPKEQVEMQKDMEAVLAAMEEARQRAPIDPTAVILRGHSGGTYLTLWLGLRQPELFLGICGDGVVFWKQTIPTGKFERTRPRYDLPILLCHGALDYTRARKETATARDELKKAGYRNVTFKIIPDHEHLPHPQTCIDWMMDLIKSTAKSRKERRKLIGEVAKLRAEFKQGARSGTLRKLADLLAREEKYKVSAGAAALYAEVSERGRKILAQARELEQSGRLVEAKEIYVDLDRTYYPLPLGKEAREHKKRVVRGDAYKADVLLQEGLAAYRKGRKEKAFELFEKILRDYPETPAAKIANENMR